MAAIGIDLGTTYSCVAVCMDGEVKIIPNDIGKNTTPSCVAIDEDGTAIVGEAAKQRSDIKAENAIFDVKRLIGRRFDDTFVLKDIQYWPFKVSNIRNTPVIEAQGRSYFPEQISAKVLTYLKIQAEEYLSEKVTNAVITVPAYFNDGQRQATKDAGEIAGLNVLRIINEPTAAAIAYNHQIKPENLEKILIFDLGGGTFDISILTMQGNNMEVIAVGGDTHLGGEDFDNSIVEYCLQEFRREHGVDLKAGKNSTVESQRFKTTKNLRRLKNECELQKINLTSARATNVSLDAMHGDTSLNVKVTRDIFNSLNQPAFDKSIAVMDKVLKENQIERETIDEIVMVGGSSKIPSVQEMVRQYFGGKLLSKVIKGDEAVAYGAALHASTMTATKEPDYFFKDVYPHPIGVRVRKETDTSHDFSPVLKQNSPIPSSATRTYYTVQKGQPAAKITIYEGEERLVDKNFQLGEFTLNLPDNTPLNQRLDVHMNLDDNGILHVKAKCDGAVHKLVVNETKGRMTQDEIDNCKMEELQLYSTYRSDYLDF